MTILLVAKSSAAGAAVSDATDANNPMIYSFSARGLIEASFTVIAGTDHPYGAYNGDSIPANTAYLNFPTNIQFDALGNLHFIDARNDRIRKVDKETGIITTVAGTGQGRFNGDGILAVYAALNPTGFTFDVSGDMFVSDSNSRIRKIASATGIITTVAGNGQFGYNGDNILATTAFLASPRAVTSDAQGNLYFAEYYNYRVRKVTRSTGLISTVAGNGVQGSSSLISNNVLATSINISPSHLAIDTSGNLYTIDNVNKHMLKISSSTGMIVKSRSINTVGAVCVDAAGSLYYSDIEAQKIYKELGSGEIVTVGADVYTSGIYVDTTGSIYVSLSAVNKIVKVALNGNVAGFPTTGPTYSPTYRISYPPTSQYDSDYVAVAGIKSPYTSFFKDEVLATEGTLRDPSDIAFDGEGNLHIADTGNRRIRRVDKYTGIITTIAGTGDRGYTADGFSAVSATFSSVSKIAFDAFSNLFFLDDDYRVRKITKATGIVSTVAGNGENTYQTGGAPAIASSIGYPTHIACDPAGNLFILDVHNVVVWRVDRSTGIMTVAFGNRLTGVYFMGKYNFLSPTAMTLDAAGHLYLTDRFVNSIMKVTLSTGAITLLGPPFFSGGSMFVDASGNIYYMEISIGQVRKISVSTGVTTIVARKQYFTGSICADSSGKIYVAGKERNAVLLVPLEANPQVVTPPTPYPTPSPPEPTLSPTAYPTGLQIGSRSIIAGVDAGVDQGGYNGDGILATTATLLRPEGITFDGQGHLFIADSIRIRRVDKGTGIMTTVAGAGEWTGSGDGGLATLAVIGSPERIVFDVYGDMYFSETFNYRIRKVTTSTGIISTAVGTGEREYNGENILGTSTSISQPGSIACDSAGNLYYTDSNGGRIRKLTRSTGLVNTIAGSGVSGSEANLDNVVALNAILDSPRSLVIDASGDLYFISSYRTALRKLTMSTGIISTIETYDGPIFLFIDKSGNIYYTTDDVSVEWKGQHLQGKIYKIAKSSGLTTMVANNLGSLSGFYVDDSGDIYVTEYHRSIVIKISRGGDITTPPTTPPTVPPSIITAPPTRPPVTVSAPPTRTSTPPPTREPTRRPTCKPSKRPQRRRPSKAPMRKPNRG